MKFVALALALFLAVGSQAAPPPPSDLEILNQARSFMMVYAERLKEAGLKAVAMVENPQLKAQLTEQVEATHTKLLDLQAAVVPYTNSFVKTIMDSTAELRETTNKDFDELKTKMNPMFNELREVLEKHYQDYYTELEPIIAEYQAKQAADMEALRAKYMPLIEKIKEKVATNSEETKTKLMPILETLQAKFTSVIESGRAMATPYLNEYREQLEAALSQVNTGDMNALKEKLKLKAKEAVDLLQGMV